jgi:glycosyltransferase involved in cell wall biosynthesis
LKFRITFVTPYFYPYVGGVQKCVLKLAEYLADLGCAVEVISSDFVPAWNGCSPQSMPFVVKRLKCIGRIAETPLVPDIGNVVQNVEADIVHINGMYPLFTDAALFSAWRSRKSTILHYHFDPVTMKSHMLPFIHVYNKFARSLIRLPDIIIATGRAYAKSSPILTAATRKIQIIPNGVENKFFEVPPRSKLHELRSRLGITDKEKVILFVGQLKRFKGLDALLHAFKILSQRTNSKLVIVGKGPEEHSLRHLAVKLGLSDSVVFAGFVSDEDLPLYYHISYLYVLPSVLRIENFGITLLEAMAAGKPVVASNLLGPNEVIDHGVNGLIFEFGSVRSLVNALLELMADEENAKTMGSKGRSKALDYTWDKVCARFLNLYNSIS